MADCAEVVRVTVLLSAARLVAVTFNPCDGKLKLLAKLPPVMASLKTTVTLVLLAAVVLTTVGGVVSAVTGAAVTVNLKVAVLVSEPEAPFTVRVVSPRAALAATFNVKVLALVVEAGLKLLVTPVGAPSRLSATESVKPPVLVKLTASVPDSVFLTVTVALPTVKLKSGVGAGAGGQATKPTIKKAAKSVLLIIFELNCIHSSVNNMIRGEWLFKPKPDGQTLQRGV